MRSRESSDVAYGGPKLAPATRYDWRLDVVTNRGSAKEESTFRTGLNADADWAGSAWIGNARSAAARDLRRRVLDLDARGGAPGRAARAAGVPLRGRRRRRRRSSSPPTTPTACGSTAPARRDRRREQRVAGGAALRDRAGPDPQRDRRPHHQRRRLPGGPAGQAAHPQADGSEEIVSSGTGWKAAKTFPEDFWRPAYRRLRAGAPRSCRRPTAAARGAATCASRATPPAPRRCCAASSRSAAVCATRRCTTRPAATPTSRSTARPRARTSSRPASPTTTTPSSTRRRTSRSSSGAARTRSASSSAAASTA